MSTINAALAIGTRRGLQNNLVWHHRRAQDIGRVQALAASGLLPRDAAGNVKLPDELLAALWRPMPGDNQSVNITDLSGLLGDTSASTPTPAPPTPPASGGATTAPAPTTPPAPASTPTATTTMPMTVPATGLPTWLKTAAALLALTGGVGGIGGAGALIASWLGKPTTAPTAPAQQPSWLAPELQYELHLGPATPSTSQPSTPAGASSGQ